MICRIPDRNADIHTDYDPIIGDEVVFDPCLSWNGNRDKLVYIVVGIYKGKVRLLDTDVEEVICKIIPKKRMISNNTGYSYCKLSPAFHLRLKKRPTQVSFSTVATNGPYFSTVGRR